MDCSINANPCVAIGVGAGCIVIVSAVVGAGLCYIRWLERRYLRSDAPVAPAPRKIPRLAVAPPLNKQFPIAITPAIVQLDLV